MHVKTDCKVLKVFFEENEKTANSSSSLFDQLKLNLAWFFNKGIYEVPPLFPVPFIVVSSMSSLHI